MKCPVCPFPGVSETAIACPACGTDLSALRRVREFPLTLLNDGIRCVAANDVDGAMGFFRAAWAFPVTRARALVLLGKCEAQRGRLGAAWRHWGAAAALGENGAASACLRRAELLTLERSLKRAAKSIGCPYRRCAQGSGSVVLMRVNGASKAPLWKCRACGRTFSGDPRSLVFRARIPYDKAYRIIVGMLGGKREREISIEESCSRATVRRLARRAAGLGPAVVQEVATGRLRPAAPLRRGWGKLVQRYG